MPIADISVKFELGLGYLLVLPFWIGLIGLLSGRVLGIQIGRWRNAVAATLGWAVGLVAGVIALGPHDQHPALVISLSVFFGVLASLPVAIILDVVTRGRHRRRRGLNVFRHPVRATRAVLSPLGRFQEVVKNARAENLLHVRYRSAGALTSPDFARRVRLVLERSGGMFVKFGQIAATRSDLLPETLTTELSNLHSNVQRLSREEVEQVLAEELDEPTEQAFAEFDSEPLAAASIGQTHRATLHDGRAVVVKLQRPGLEDVVARDSAVLSFVARQLDRRVEMARRIGVRDLADELIISIEAELDYGREVEAGFRLRENRGSDVGVQIPVVHPTLSTRHLLVMDEVKGRSLSDAAAVDAVPVSRTVLAQRLLGSFLSQILRDGYYHADPHPGNVLIDPEGTLWLLDFGAVGRIDPISREALQGIALGFTLSDASLVARAVRHLVGDEKHIDLRQLERDLSLLLGEVQTGGISPAAMGGVIDVIERHGLRPPRPMLLLSRTLITLEGTLKVLAPGFDLGTEAHQLVASDHREDLGTPEEVVQRELIRALPALRSLPDHAEAIASQWRAGRMVVRTERYSGADRGVMESWLNRTLVGLATAAGAVTSATLLVAGSLSPDKGVQDVIWTLGFSGLTGTAVLLLRTVAQALHAQLTQSD
ncbi:MAG TPA: AarF/UbiB family protein [Solirubrobacteraceae bacterium]|nr:AarF/UbiB family protein [Solirubrobacteraceae bacterium]